MTVYDMAINNLANYFDKTQTFGEDNPNSKRELSAFDAFKASEVLEVVFCKAKEEIIVDIANANSQ